MTLTIIQIKDKNNDLQKELKNTIIYHQVRKLDQY